jgi:hypothetical protein
VGALVKALDTWPADLRSYTNEYESFGSWQLVVRRCGLRTRFVFDGRDRLLMAERLSRDSGDHPVRPKLLAETALPDGLTCATVDRVIEFIRVNST